MIDSHDVAGHPHLVAVREWIIERHGRDHARLARIGNINDGGAEMIVVGNMPDEGMAVADRDLTCSGEIKMAQAADIAGERRLRQFDIHAGSSSECRRCPWREPQTNCTAIAPSAPKSACRVSPFWACTTRGNEPASTRGPGSSVTP